MSGSLARYLAPGTVPDVIRAYSELSERASSALFGLEDEVVIVDIETTGIDPERDRIIEVAALLCRGPETIDRFHTMVDPGRSIPESIVQLTGIDASMVRGAPSSAEAASALVDFVGGRDVIAHNAAFDREFLQRATLGREFVEPWLDSVRLTQIALPRLRSHTLSDLAAAFGVHTPTHRAGDDVEALARIWRIALCALDLLPRGLVQELATVLAGYDPKLSATLAQVSFDQRVVAFDLREERKRLVLADDAEAMQDAREVELRIPSETELAEAFSDTGLAGRMYTSFESRAEQLQMARAVTEAFAEGRHAAIEAGTGVGKSLAYLAPAAYIAQASGVGIGIATKTNSLLDQLVHGELPALSSAIEADLRFVSLKGYDHYPCLRKLEKVMSDPQDMQASEVVSVATLASWTTQSAWGDLDSVNTHWTTGLRQRICASISECTRKKCRYFPNLCYLHGTRRKAGKAHIVVTNHALLFRDAATGGGILPTLRHWIVDEAHAAEAEARRQLTLETSHRDLGATLALLHTKGRGGILEGVRRKALQATSVTTTDLIHAVDLLEERIGTAIALTDSFFDYVKDIGGAIGDAEYTYCELRIDGRIRETREWAAVERVGASLAKHLEAIIEAGRNLVLLFEEAGRDFSETGADVAGALSRIAGQREAIMVVLTGERPDLLYYAVIDRRPHVKAERLCAASVDVGQIIAEELFPQADSMVFTSATLASGDDFSHFVRGVGLDRLGPAGFRTIRLDSSYDFDRQMAVFVPDDIPEPNRPKYKESIEALLFDTHVAMGGSILTLFTNRREMEALYSALAPKLKAEGIALLVQGKGTSPKRLREQFIADEQTSLFATKAFWEGFDAKGRTLRGVVIPKLPFGRPDQPLAAERESREGSAAWRKYALPEAIIELKQAAGRLIRSAEDTGCLVIADSRVLSKTYGREFLSALPVGDVEVLPAEQIIREIRDRFSHL